MIDQRSVGYRLLTQLPAKQQQFVLALLSDPKRNQTQAYEKVYKARGESAAANAARLLGNDRVRPAYEALETKQVEKAIASAELTEADVMRAIARNVRAVGLADIRDLYDEKGNLRPVQELSDEAAMLVGGFEVVQRRVTSGNKETDTVIKVKLRDHAKFVELGARVLNLLTEKVEGEGNWNELAARLASARQKP